MENKHLKTIQVLFKIARVVSVIAFVCSIIGVVGCVISMATISSCADLEVDGMTLRELIESNSGLPFDAFNVAFVSGILACGGGIASSAVSKKAFKNELSVGTPFDHKVAKDMMVIGILEVAIPIVVAFITSIVVGIYEQKLGVEINLNMEIEVNLALGIFFLILSAIFHYGADVKSK